MSEKKVISFISSNYPFLNIKFGERKPKKEISFVHGTYQTDDPEEIEAIRQSIRRKAVTGLSELSLIHI